MRHVERLNEQAQNPFISAVKSDVSNNQTFLYLNYWILITGLFTWIDWNFLSNFHNKFKTRHW